MLSVNHIVLYDEIKTRLYTKLDQQRKALEDKSLNINRKKIKYIECNLIGNQNDDRIPIKIDGQDMEK